MGENPFKPGSGMFCWTINPKCFHLPELDDYQCIVPTRAFVSLLITSTGFASSELARRGVNAPTSQSLLNYILLALVYGGTLLYKRQHMTIKWYYHLILGIVDVEANYIGMLQDETNIKPLWGTAQLFLHPRYMHGAATRKTKIAARHKHNS